MSKSRIANISIKEKEFMSSTNKGNKISIKMVKNKDSIEFFGFMKEIKPSKKYYLKELEVELLKNNYLTTGVNISGIFKILVYYVDKKTYNVLEGDNFIKLIFDIEHPIIKTVNFILSERKGEENEENYNYNELSNFVYNDLVEKINTLEEKNKTLETKNSDLEYRVSKLENIIKQLMNRTKEIEIKSGMESKDFNYERIFNSKIDFDEGLVKTWLDNKNFRAKLLFRMTEDGENFKTFHQKCDNKGSTMTIIETENGLIFGGYTDLNWDTSNIKKNDKDTFLFSFNHRKKYPKRNDNYSIYCSDTQGPKFGHGPQIYFDKNFKRGLSDSTEGNSFVLNNKFVNGERSWNTKEMEVFQIEYQK